MVTDQKAAILQAESFQTAGNAKDLIGKGAVWRLMSYNTN